MPAVACGRQVLRKCRVTAHHIFYQQREREREGGGRDRQRGREGEKESDGRGELGLGHIGYNVRSLIFIGSSKEYMLLDL